jgi:hypothetical protein
MRRTCWAMALLATLGLIGSAAAAELVHPKGAPCTKCQKSHSFAAPACGAPVFGTTVGCCEQPPTACDNAWDGYCQEKQHWQSFWYRIGTGAGRRYRGRCVTYSTPCPSKVTSDQPLAEEPDPAAPTAPLPAPTAVPPVPKPAAEDAASRYGPLRRR